MYTLVCRDKNNKNERKREIEREKIEPLNLANTEAENKISVSFEHMQPIHQTIYRVFRRKISLNYLGDSLFANILALRDSSTHAFIQILNDLYNGQW